MGYLFKTIRSGMYKPAGTVDIPFLGAKVGELNNWTLTRRGDFGRDSGLYDLHASFSFVSDALWNDDEYAKVIFLNLAPMKQYRVDIEPDARTVREGRTLLIEKVTIHDTSRREPDHS
jgi:hypothetical protein